MRPSLREIFPQDNITLSVLGKQNKHAPECTPLVLMYTLWLSERVELSQEATHSSVHLLTKIYLSMSLVKITITVAKHINSDVTKKCLSANRCSAADLIHTAVVYGSYNLKNIHYVI